MSKFNNNFSSATIRHTATFIMVWLIEDYLVLEERLIDLQVDSS